MRGATKSSVVRRSFAIPRTVVEDAQAVAPEELRQNLNGLVVQALKNYAQAVKKTEFEKAMAEMAADPGIRYEISAVSEGLMESDSDGLGDGDDKKG